jgi:hypothetical protein
MAETTESPETNPFMDHLGSVASILAFWHKRNGEAGLRKLLALTASEPVPAEPWLLTLEQCVRITTRESLEDTARELESTGLRKLAKIVREHAAARPREIDLPDYEPGTINHRAWLAIPGVFTPA